MSKMNQSNLILFLDESGDSNLCKINPQYPIFGLGGVILDEDYYNKRVITEVDNFKIEIFDKREIILHSRLIRKKEKDFFCLRNQDLWNKFNSELANLFQNLNFSVISVVIRKKEHVQKYRRPYSPYHYSLEIVIESFVKILYRLQRYGYIIAEARGKREDRELIEVFNNFVQNGTRFIRAHDIKNKNLKLKFHKKSDHITGLELSDLCIGAITQAVLYDNYSRQDYKIVMKKMDQWHGLKIKP